MNPTAWILLTGCLTAAACGLLGSFLVLRRMAMVGDAISHAVLPGIVLAFLATHSRHPMAMLLGALLIGLFTAYCIEFLHRTGRLQSDAAIGITFTWLFALGVVLVSAYTGQVDLDQECVLYGEIAYVPWDVWMIGDRNFGPRAVWMLGTTLLVNLGFVASCYKELQITTFDPDFASSIGISPRRYHYLLMAAVAFTTVAAFEAVGAILVIGLLIVPAAAASLLTDRLHRLCGLSMLLGCASAVSGYYVAGWLNASIAGAMAMCAGVIFAAVALLAPQHGFFRGR